MEATLKPDCVVCAEAVECVNAHGICAWCELEALQCSICRKWSHKSTVNVEPSGAPCGHSVCNDCEWDARAKCDHGMKCAACVGGVPQ